MNNKENITIDIDTLLNNNQDDEYNLKNQTIEIKYNDFYRDLMKEAIKELSEEGLEIEEMI